MTKLLLALSMFLFISKSNSEIKWDVIYTNATYALNHSKKAMSSNNFDHQRYYSEKALLAYDKIAKDLKNYDDEDLKLKIAETINDLEHAVDAPDWDRGRFYTKRVYLNTLDFITKLDLMSSHTASHE